MAAASRESLNHSFARDAGAEHGGTGPMESSNGAAPAVAMEDGPLPDPEG